MSSKPTTDRSCGTSQAKFRSCPQDAHGNRIREGENRGDLRRLKQQLHRAMIAHFHIVEIVEQDQVLIKLDTPVDASRAGCLSCRS